MIKKQIIKFGLGFVSLGIVSLLLCYLIVCINAIGRTYDIIKEILPHKYGLLFGTSLFTAQGARNYYFENRIKSAAELYKADKIKQIIVSGGDFTRTLGKSSMNYAG